LVLTIVCRSSTTKEALNATVPQKWVCTIRETEPVVQKARRAANSFKPAILDNGVQGHGAAVCGQDEKIVVNTETMGIIRARLNLSILAQEKSLTAGGQRGLRRLSCQGRCGQSADRPAR